MKGAILFYHSTFDEEVRRRLEAVGCNHFLEIPTAWAQDGSDRRFGTHVYPGTDSVILAFVPDPMADDLTRMVAELKDEQKGQPRLAIFPLEEFF